MPDPGINQILLVYTQHLTFLASGTLMLMIDTITQLFSYTPTRSNETILMPTSVGVDITTTVSYTLLCF